jgi:predicted PurR-regulated permease PerM
VRGEPVARERSALRWLVLVLALAALAVLVPFWAPLTLAAWVAIIAAPLQRRVVKLIGHRKLAAGLLTALLVLAFLAPILVATLSLSQAALSLGQRVMASHSGADALKALSSGGPSGGIDLHHLDAKRALELARSHGANALRAAGSVFGAATGVVLGVVVFVAGFYVFLVDGKRAHDWLLERAPLSHAHFHRFANVFVEVGHGMLIGVGLTAVAQGAIATIGYLVTGVPQALVLGLVTMFASLIPSIGSGLVWAPVAAGLALSNRPVAAIVMLGIGLFVSVVDNLLRPVLAHFGELRMHGLLLFVAMLGGIMLIGGWGLLLGPLLVRAATEGLTILREQRPAT